MIKHDNETRDLALIDKKAEDARREMTGIITPEQEMAAMLGGGLLRELSTFTGSPAEVWAKIQDGSASDVQPVSSHLNKRINLVDFYCHEVDLESETTGEIIRKIRTVMYDANGSRYSCVSDGVAKDIWRIMQYGLTPTKDNPLAIMVVQIQLKGPNRMYRINQYKE